MVMSCMVMFVTSNSVTPYGYATYGTPSLRHPASLFASLPATLHRVTLRVTPRVTPASLKHTQTIQ